MRPGARKRLIINRLYYCGRRDRLPFIAAFRMRKEAWFVQSYFIRVLIPHSDLPRASSRLNHKHDEIFHSLSSQFNGRVTVTTFFELHSWARCLCNVTDAAILQGSSRWTQADKRFLFLSLALSAPSSFYQTFTPCVCVGALRLQLLPGDRSEA